MSADTWREGLVALFENLALPTARLGVRRFSTADLTTGLQHEQNPTMMRFIRDVVPRAELEAKLRAQCGAWSAADGDWLYLPMHLHGAPEMLGIVAVRVVAAERELVEIGYCLHPDHQRLGYTMEAMVALLDLLVGPGQVRKVVAYCVAENVASWRLMEKLGMQREGQLREYSKIGDVWHDELVYGLLNREWRARRAEGTT